ncbi:hypothetical protein ACIRU3_07110 [Streptomyces sp. NPDC101151]|uniref:hypothetical protein n=1 Tax=Streptomyces sp. NPDC101151 TaxID=3366115 RepID=UPI00381B56AD
MFSTLARLTRTAFNRVTGRTTETVVDGPGGSTLYTAEEIEAAGLERISARELANEGARRQRPADKILKSTRTGVYGSVRVEWVETGRMVWDRTAIERRFREVGEPIPRKPADPTIRVVLIEQPAPAAIEETAASVGGEGGEWVTDFFSTYRPAGLAAA